MKKSYKSLFWVAALNLIGGVSAQEMMTLQQYCTQVVDYSQQLKQTKEQTLSITAKKKADYTGFLPKLSVAATGSLDLTNLNLWDAPVGSYHPYTHFSGGVITQNIWAGGAVHYQYQSDKIQEKIALETQQLTLDNICLQAQIAYWTLSANQDLLDISRQYQKIIATQYEIIKLRFDDGAIAKNDLLMITTRLKETELGIKKAETSLLVAIQNYHILMGVAPDAPHPQTEKISRPLPLPERWTLEQALNERPDYQSAQLQTQLAQKTRKLALSKFNPQISLQLQGGWGTSNPNLGIDPQTTVLSTLTFSMPLWNWGERCYTNRQYRALANATLYNRQIVMDQISQELSTAWTNVDQNHLQIRIAQENLKLAQESLDLNTYSYNEGKITISEVLSSQLSWIQAYTSLITAHYAYKVAVAQYYKAIGQCPY